MTNELAPRQERFIIQTMDDAERAARAMSASGFFQDARQASQAVVKILAGQELGFGPFASMTGVHIIKNKPVLAANLMAAAVKRGGKYNYRVVEHGSDVCEIEFFENGESVGKSRFDKGDAQAAGLLNRDNWKKYPRNMYFARALSNGQKWYAPDVFGGTTVYTPDELGADVDDEGNAVHDASVDPRQARLAETKEMFEVREPEIIEGTATDQVTRPLSASAVKSYLHSKADRYDDEGRTASDAQRGLVVGILGQATKGDQERYAMTSWLWGVTSFKDVTDGQLLAMLDWFTLEDADGGGYIPSKDAETEMGRVLKAVLWTRDKWN